MDALHDYFISRPQLRELYDLLEQVGYNIFDWRRFEGV